MNDRAKQRRHNEIAASRARLLAHLQQVIGPALSTESAQVILEQAAAWGPRSARELDTHIAADPQALTAPSGHCPTSLVRLLRALQAAGHGDAITLLGCAGCGRTDDRLPRRTSAGRCCNWCAGRDTRKPCARCGRAGHIAARRPEGPICRRCYHLDPDVVTDCAQCGRRRRATVRRVDGSALCDRCAPRPEQRCVGCAIMRPVEANSTEGPLCRACHQRPGRRCGICQRTRPIHVRAVPGAPDICAGCYRGTTEECAKCGRTLPGFRHRGGEFYCQSCQPRPVQACQDCGRTRPVKVTGWPIGALCASCYSRRKRNPRPCSRCASTRVLVARTPDRDELCGPCAGAEDLDFTCRRCGVPGQIHAGDGCARCVLGDRLRNLLHGPDGAVPPQLQPLLDALIAAEKPHSVLEWLATSPSATLLAGLAAHPGELTHELLDALAQDQSARHVRDTLMATGILPDRQENLARLQLWTTNFLTTLPPHQELVIHPFAEWQVLRDARRHAARGRYTAAAAAHDRTDIRVAAEFLAWLDSEQRELAGATQDDLDLWLTLHPTRRRRLGTFIRWATARRLTGTLVIPGRRMAMPSQFLTHTEHFEQLRRCLTDEALPREVRITGALIRLYALPLTRISELTTDRFHRDGDHAYLTFDRNPVLLPPRLARLVEEQIERPARASVLPPPSANQNRFLLPGRPPSRPRSASSLHNLMARHGLPSLSARNTAMIEAVSNLPPIVVSDLFGIAPGTANRWAQYAQASWADYLAVDEAEEQRKGGNAGSSPSKSLTPPTAPIDSRV